MATIVRVFTIGLFLQFGVLAVVMPAVEILTGSAVVAFVVGVALSIGMWGLICQALREPKRCGG